MEKFLINIFFRALEENNLAFEKLFVFLQLKISDVIL